MSQEVKRYDAVHIRYEDSNIRYGEGCEVEVVAAYDYDRDTQALREQVEAMRKDAAAGAVVWKFIDRMSDPADCDPAERILAEFVAAFEAALQAKP